MNGFDDELREALRRRQPPEYFSEKVLARVRQQSSPRPRSYFRAWIAAAAAAVMLVMLGLPAYREHTRRVEGERAKEQVMQALRMTGATLRSVQERVQQHTVEMPAQ